MGPSRCSAGTTRSAVGQLRNPLATDASKDRGRHPSDPGSGRLCNSLKTVQKNVGARAHLEECTALAMVSWRRHPERIAAAATALLLQMAIYMVLSERQVSVRGIPSGPKLVARILAGTAPRDEAPPPLRAREHLIPIPMTAHPAVRPMAPSAPQTHPSRPLIDWQGAIQHEVGAELSRIHAPPQIRFGFPRMPARGATPPAFGWDEKRLNRVQRLAHGIIDLGGNCVILLWPPIPLCHSDPANGDLFKHMHDPRPPEGPNTLP